MLKERRKYIDFNGNEREEDFYFNLTEAEIAMMELNTKGGLEQMVHDIIDAKEEGKLAEIFESLLLKSYGKKSPDGRGFMKSEAISNEFKQTMAYSDLFIKLVSDANYAAEWINGVIAKPTAKNNQTSVSNLTPVNN